ncbi:MAG TPA: hypothetical protein PLN83_11650, partial [Syntrophorhabdus sp.]|nr:hypothetical protein [Syntrophorhabdus sp.]
MPGKERQEFPENIDAPDTEQIRGIPQNQGFSQVRKKAGTILVIIGEISRRIAAIDHLTGKDILAVIFRGDWVGGLFMQQQLLEAEGQQTKAIRPACQRFPCLAHQMKGRRSGN